MKQNFIIEHLFCLLLGISFFILGFLYYTPFFILCIFNFLYMFLERKIVSYDFVKIKQSYMLFISIFVIIVFPIISLIISRYNSDNSLKNVQIFTIFFFEFILYMGLVVDYRSEEEIDKKLLSRINYNKFQMIFFATLGFIFITFMKADISEQIKSFDKYRFAYVKKDDFEKLIINNKCKIIVKAEIGLFCYEDLDNSNLLLSQKKLESLSDKNIFKDQKFFILRIEKKPTIQDYQFKLKYNYDLGNNYSINDFKNSLNELNKFIMNFN